MSIVYIALGGALGAVLRFFLTEYVNNNIAGPYQKLFGYIDRWIMLRAPSFEQVCSWRLEQEQKLMEKHQISSIKTPDEIMNPEEINSFIQHYQRVTESILDDLPKRVHHLYQLNEDRVVTAYSWMRGYSCATDKRQSEPRA